MLRSYLWQMDNGKLPIWPGVHHVHGDSNSWQVDQSSISSVTNGTGSEVYPKSYEPLGPTVIPLQRIDLPLVGFNSDLVLVNIHLYSTMSEGSFQKASFPEIEHPDWFDSPPYRQAFSKEKQYRAYTNFEANGAISIDVPVLGATEIPFALRENLLNATYSLGYKPLAITAGGLRPTGKTIEDELRATFQAGTINTYLPRHAFIPTESSVDFDPEFLLAAHKKLEANYPSNLSSWRFSDGTHLNSLDWLDSVRLVLGLPWEPFSPSGNAGAWKMDTFSILGPGQVSPTSCSTTAVCRASMCYQGHCTRLQWRGTPSPFSYIVIQDAAFEHTKFSKETTNFVLERVFSPQCLSPKPLPVPPPIQSQVRQLVLARQYIPQRIPGALPPVPPCIACRTQPDQMLLKQIAALPRN